MITTQTRDSVQKEDIRKSNTFSNPCFRCGKQRITIHSFKDRIGDSVVTSTETVCPDPECQAQVEKQLNKERLQRERLLAMNKRPFYSGGRKKKKRVNIY